MTVARMAEAVTAFNASANSGMIVFDEYPGNPHGTINLDQVAATAKLHMDGEYVIATVKLLETPMGKIAEQLYDAIGLQVCPVTTGIPQYSGLKLEIRHLIIPQHKMNTAGPTPLKQVQNWINKTEYWPRYELREHK